MIQDFEVVRPLLNLPCASQIFVSMLDEPFALAGAAHAAASHPEAPLVWLERFERAFRAYEEAFIPDASNFPGDFDALDPEAAARAIGNENLAAACLLSEGFSKDDLLINALCGRGIREFVIDRRIVNGQLREVQTYFALGIGIEGWGEFEAAVIESVGV